MNEEPMPGTNPADQELDRRWRQQSVEEPSSPIDARIRAAARDAVAPSTPYGRTPGGSSRWTRFVPLAAAASVALLAVGLVRLMPHEEYQAIPTPETARPGKASEPASAAPSEPEPAVDSSLADPFYAMSEDRLKTPEPESGPTRAQPAEDVAAQKSSTARDPEATGNEQASVEQAAKAREAAPPPATALGPAGIATAVAPAESRRADPAVTSALPAALAVQVQNDAAQRTGLDPDSIRIVAVDPIAWLDASLGCEAAGAPAAETRVPGYVVTVDAAGTMLRYHTDGRDQIRLCATDDGLP